MTARCEAVVFNYSATDRPGASPDANGSVNAWQVTVTAPGDGNVNGDFIGNSADNGGGSAAGAGTSAWALYANSGQTADATAAISSLAGKVLDTTGEFISLDFDNGWIESGGVAGVSFLDASNNVQSTFRFSNGTANYRIDDSTSSFDTGIGFTADGFTISLTLTDQSGGYTLEVGSNTFSNRTLAQATSNIAAIRVFNQNAGGGGERNLYFNNLVVSAVPEVSPALAIPFAAAICGGIGALVRRRRLSANCA
jgi:hypothetical protein